MRILSELRGTRKEPRETRRDRRERTRWDPPVSLWYDTGRRVSHPAPSTDIDADVVVVGGGLTGLWSAVLIAEAAPTTRVVVFDAVQPGFGASGRNGGWCSALLPADDAHIARVLGPDAAGVLHSAARSAVDSIGDYIRTHGIECGWAKAGTLTVATNELQLERIRRQAEMKGGPEFLDAEGLRSRLRVEGALGATFVPDCAALDPHALLTGLLGRCRDLGVRVFGGTRVTSVHREHVVARTPDGLVYATCRQVVVATEAYLPRMPGMRRQLAPVYSYVIATDPLPAGGWEQIGWEGRETLGEAGHMVTYAQRTADGRIVFGGRGAPYAFGSDVHSSRDRSDAVHERVIARMHELFPATRGVHIPYRWGGPLGMPRDLIPGVWQDRRTGAIHAGGYTGDGVAMSHLLATIIAARVAGDADDPVLSLPLNDRRPRQWEPEPIRWLGINAFLAAARLADRNESRNRRSRVLQRILSRF